MAKQPAFVPQYVRVSRAPEVFDISEDTIRRAEKRGEVSIYKRGNGAFVKVEEIAAWIEGRAA